MINVSVVELSFLSELDVSLEVSVDSSVNLIVNLVIELVIDSDVVILVIGLLNVESVILLL